MPYRCGDDEPGSRLGRCAGVSLPSGLGIDDEVVVAGQEAVVLEDHAVDEGDPGADELRDLLAVALALVTLTPTFGR
ncbi:MAG: hypothetical protein JWN02_813 [Acidobacteria bacterium]|nr:hypothetical protein [Acidobacteriota bacterium]